MIVTFRKAIDLLSQPQYEQFFVDLMMVKELNMQAILPYEGTSECTSTPCLEDSR